MSLEQPPASELAAPAADRPAQSQHGAEPAKPPIEQLIEQSLEQSIEPPVEHSSATPPALAATTQRLATLQGLALVEHPDVYQRIHSDLQSVLADIDDA